MLLPIGPFFFSPSCSTPPPASYHQRTREGTVAVAVFFQWCASKCADVLLATATSYWCDKKAIFIVFTGHSFRPKCRSAFPAALSHLYSVSWRYLILRSPTLHFPAISPAENISVKKLKGIIEVVLRQNPALRTGAYYARDLLFQLVRVGKPEHISREAGSSSTIYRPKPIPPGSFSWSNIWYPIFNSVSCSTQCPRLRTPAA